MPTPLSPRSVPLCFLLLLAIASSCGKEEETTARAEVLFEREAARPVGVVGENLDLKKSSHDDWPTEILHDNAKHSLKELFHAMLDGDFDRSRAATVLAEDFAGASALQPATLEVVRETGRLQVRRESAGALAPSGEGGEGGRNAFLQQVEAMSKQFGGKHAHADFKIISVDPQDAAHFATHVLVQMHGLEGGPLLANMDWSVVWSGTPEVELPTIHSLQRNFYEEIEAPQPLFAELTEEVFGAFPFFARDFLQGSADLYRRSDRLSGNSMMGWQGLAVGDVNGDGLDDLYICQPGGLPNRLFLRQADGRATETAEAAGVAFLENSRAALLVDLDNDGDQDLVVSMGSHLVIGYNDGRGGFAGLTPVTPDGVSFVHSLTAADYDQDGDLDVYACRYNTGESGALGGGLPVPYHDADNGGRNVLLRNDGRSAADPGQAGRGIFTDVTSSVGLEQNNSKFSLASVWEDFDNDGDLDLFVANDFGRNNFYRNDDGRFTDVAEAAGLGDLAASMGATVSDYDRDGDLDLYLSNMFSSAGLRIASQEDRFKSDNEQEREAFLSHARGNFLFSNNGDGTFSDVTDEAGVSLGRWAWGARFVDFDNDSYEDLYIPNGFITGPDKDDL